MSERINYTEQNNINGIGVCSMNQKGGFPYSQNLWSLLYNFKYSGTTQRTYTVTFTENGLPSGTTWSVTLAGTTKSSSTNTITFSEPNDSYSFSVGNMNGYTANPSSGTINVNGMNVNQAITFTALTNQFIPGTLVQVVWSSINVRTGPGTSYSIIATESYGA